MLENFDPNTIQDEAVRQVVIDLMNLVENLHAKVKSKPKKFNVCATRTIASRENRASLPSSRTNLPRLCLRKRNAGSPNPTTKLASRPRSE